VEATEMNEAIGLFLPILDNSTKAAEAS